MEHVDLGIASDANELKEQLATISGYTDRSRVQRDFLSQKATVRYWMDQISRFGGAQDLAENLFNNRDNHDGLARVWLQMTRLTLASTDLFHGQMLEKAYFQSLPIWTCNWMTGG